MKPFVRTFAFQASFVLISDDPLCYGNVRHLFMDATSAWVTGEGACFSRWAGYLF